jgi:hypothetical protein
MITGQTKASEIQDTDGFLHRYAFRDQGLSRDLDSPPAARGEWNPLFGRSALFTSEEQLKNPSGLIVTASHDEPLDAPVSHTPVGAVLRSAGSSYLMFGGLVVLFVGLSSPERRRRTPEPPIEH